MTRHRLIFLRRAALLLFVLILSSGLHLLHAQTSTATLSGLIVDPEKARIPDAKLTLRNNASRDVRNGSSNGEGAYSFTALPPGTYTLTVERDGFATARQVNIDLHPADVRELNVTMKIGETKIEIVVTEAEQTQDTGEKSSLISASDIEHLSVQGRDVSELVKTQPGFAIVPGYGLTNGSYDPGQVTVGGGLSSFSANGAPTSGINITSDGVDITDPSTGNTTTQNINQEMVQEVKIETSAFGADQAKGPIVLNAVGKSGGTNFHGSLYTYLRHHSMNTGNWFSKNQGLPDVNDRYIYPGAQISGPVLLPLAPNFNRTRKLTFFLGAEDYAQRNTYAYGSALTSSVLALVPTANMRAGNFTRAELANYLGTDPQTLLNQCTPTGSLANYLHICGQPTGSTNGGFLVTDGMIPTSEIDPGAAAIFNAMPLPNRPTKDGFNYLTTNFVNNDMWQLNARIDDAISDKAKLQVTYSTERGRIAGIPESQYYSPANGGPSMGGINTPGKMASRVFTQSLGVHYTYIFGPTMTNEAYVSANLNRSDFKPLRPELLQGSAVGYPYQGIYQGATQQFPQLADYGYDGLPIGLFPDFSVGKLFRNSFTPTFGDNFTKTIRTHTIKLGVYVQRVTANGTPAALGITGAGTNGQIAQYYLPAGSNFTNPDGSAGRTFSSSVPSGTACQDSNGLPVACINPGGNFLADFAIGDISQFYQQNFLTNLNLFYWNTDFFVNDQYKVTSRLTLSYGIRIQHLGAWQDTHGNGIAVFSDDLYRNPVRQILPGFTWHGADPSVPNSGTPSRMFFYSPRVGIAYDLYGNGRTVLRGGFGLYRSHDSSTDYANAAATAKGMYISTVGGGGIQLSKLQTATPVATDCVLHGTGCPAVVTDCLNQTLAGQNSKCPSLNTTVYGLDAKDNEQPLTLTYNFTVTQRVPHGSIFEIGYTGSQNRNLLLQGTLQNINALPIGALFKPDPITNTFVAPSSLSIAQQGDYRKYHPYQSVYVPRHISYSFYNALQASWNRTQGKFRHGFNYTWSKNLGLRYINGQPGDPIELRNNYGPTNADRTHIFNATYSYDFGRLTRRRGLGVIANNWEISGITGLQSGPNLQANYSFNFKLKGVVGYYNVNSITFLGTPEVNLQPTLTCDPSAGRVSKQFAKGECFQLPQVGGANGPFNYPYLHGPAYFNSDLTLIKNFPMEHSRNIQVRLAAFNFLNHPITSFSGRFPNESNLYFSGNTASTAVLRQPTGASAQNCSIVGSDCFGYAGYKQGRRVVEVAAKFTF